MKKGILLVAMFVASTMGVMAQESAFGLRGGLNIANVSGDGTDDAESKLGFHLGAFYNMGLTENIGFQPEVLYTTKGYKSTYEESWSTSAFNGATLVPGTATDKGEISVTLSYIQIPLLFTYTTDGVSGLQFVAGPSVGFLMGSKLKDESEYTFTSTDGTYTESESFDVEDDDTKIFNSMDVGAQIGLGYIMESGLGISVRYDYGFSNIIDTDNDDADKVHNSNIMVSLSYSLFR